MGAALGSVAEGGLDLDVIGVGAGMSSCRTSERWTFALQILRKAVAASMEPTVVTFNTMGLSAEREDAIS